MSSFLPNPRTSAASQLIIIWLTVMSEPIAKVALPLVGRKLVLFVRAIILFQLICLLVGVKR